jgi:hypothetical protein
VSVVLIEATKTAKAPLPVLTRGSVDPATQRERGVIAQDELTSPFPTILSVVPPNQQTSAQLGDTLTIEGRHLDGSNLVVRFSSARLPNAIEMAPLAGHRATRVQVTIPNEPAAWSAGIYTVAVMVQRPGETFQRTTNGLLLPLAPAITTALPFSVGRDSNGDATITLTCRPEVRPQQRAVLILGDLEIQAQPHPAQTGSLSFIVKKAIPGTYYIRLRVDGADSLLVNRAVRPPSFFNHKVTITA